MCKRFVQYEGVIRIIGSYTSCVSDYTLSDFLIPHELQTLSCLRLYDSPTLSFKTRKCLNEKKNYRG